MVFLASSLMAVLPLLLLLELVHAQSNNITAIGGTWSSGSGAVSTGPVCAILR